MRGHAMYVRSRYVPGQVNETRDFPSLMLRVGLLRQ